MAHVKRERVSEEHKIDDGNDIISQLPDCVLHHILSFLPTVDAVATCILSKRWEYLWTFVPVVDIDELPIAWERYPHDPHYEPNFINFVDRVLRQRNTSSMKKFRLYFHIDINASRINDWVSAAIRQNVEELELSFFGGDHFMLPSCVFDNAFIKVLKLELNCTLGLPPRISFPHLKKLRLSQVTFPSDDLMQRLFCTCPSLEELAILHCYWNNMKNLAVAMPSLKTLVIADQPFLLGVDHLPGCEVKINAINLITFEYEGFLTNEINVLGLSSSAVPSINIPWLRFRHREMAQRTCKLLRGLRNVCRLRINIDFLLRVQDILVSLPVFPNLTLLELSEEPVKRSTKLLIKFLMFLPKLEVLHLCGGLRWGEDDFKLELVPECISSSLKTVNYHDLRGTNGEIYFLKSLLQRASVLEKMNVFWSSCCYPRKRKYKEAQNELLAAPIGSNNCVLIFTSGSDS